MTDQGGSNPQPGNKNWFSTGFEEVDKVEQAQQQRRSAFNRFNLRFNRETNKGEEATVCFLDPDTEKDVPGFWEHEYDTLDGAWYNYNLCPRGHSPCLMCERRLQPYFAGAMSILRLSPKKDNMGRELINVKELLIAKTESMQRLRRMFEQRKGLVGTVWSVFRTSSRAAKIGDDWQFQKKIEGGREGIARELRLSPEQVKPFVYSEVLIMKSKEDLLREPIDWNKSAEKGKNFGDSRGGGGGGGGNWGSRSSGGSSGAGDKGTGVPYDR